MRTLAVCQRWLYVFVGWLGGTLGIVTEVRQVITQPLYGYSETHGVLEGGLPRVTEIGPVEVYANGITIAIVALVVVLVFGTAVVLVTLGKRGLFSAYSFGLLLFSLLSLPSIGWVFLPATVLLSLAAILSWLPGSTSRTATPPNA